MQATKLLKGPRDRCIGYSMRLADAHGCMIPSRNDQWAYVDMYSWNEGIDFLAHATIGGRSCAELRKGIDTVICTHKRKNDLWVRVAFHKFGCCPRRHYYSSIQYDTYHGVYRDKPLPCICGANNWYESHDPNSHSWFYRCGECSKTSYQSEKERNKKEV